MRKYEECVILIHFSDDKECTIYRRMERINHFLKSRKSLIS